MRLKTLSTLILFIGLTASLNAQMIILSGPTQGTYKIFVDDMINVLGGDTSGFVNVVSTGSGNNYKELIDPTTPVKIAMVQVDYLYYQQMLDRKNNTEFADQVQVLLPLANEEIHLVTKKSSGIRSLADLKEKIVGVGTQQSGTYATAIMIKDKSEVFWNTKILDFDQSLRELMGDKIDAFFAVGTAPLLKLDLNPISMVEPITVITPENINDWARYKTPGVIESADYKWLDYDVPTYSVRTLLVVNESKLTEDDRLQLLKLVNGLKTNLEVLKLKGHEKWREVDFNDWDSSNWRIMNMGVR